MDNDLFTINNFAKLFNTTVKTLRFYEKIELFMPAYVNTDNGYRYYKYEQINVFSEIIQFKNAGFCLNEIKHFLHNEMNIEDKRTALLNQQKTLNDVILRFERLNIKQFTNNASIITLPQLYTVGITKTFSNIECAYQAYAELAQLCVKNKLTLSLPCRTLLRYNNTSFSLENYEATLAICVEKSYDPLVACVPSGKFLSTLFRGNFEDIGNAYAYLYDYAKQNNIICGDCTYELYEVSQSPSEYDNQFIIEILLPIKTIT